MQEVYWVFFKPTVLRAHINQITPGYEERLLDAERTRFGKASVTMRELRDNPALRTFVFKALLVEVVIPVLLYTAIGLTYTALGGHFNWQKSWSAVAGGVLFGVAGGVAGGVLFGVALGVAYTRLPIYLLEIVPAIQRYGRVVRERQFEREMSRSPLYFDELIVLPLPYLSSLLFHLLQQDLKAGLKHLSFIANHPAQDWAAQKALKRLLAEDRIPFFSFSTVFSQFLNLMNRSPCRPLRFVTHQFATSLRSRFWERFQTFPGPAIG